MIAQGSMHGYGRLISSNGTVFVGQFENGFKNGAGTETLDGDIVREGLWEMDEFQDFEEEFDDAEVELEVAAPLTQEQIDLLTGAHTHNHEDGEECEYYEPLRRMKEVIFFDKMGGIFVPPICRDQFWFLVAKRQWRFIIFKVDTENKDSVLIDKCGLRDSTYEEFLESMTEDEPRWVIYDYEYEAKEYGIMSMKSKLVLIVFSPDDCTDNKSKSIITYKKDLLMKRITHHTSINKNLATLTIHKFADLELEAIKSKLK